MTDGLALLYEQLDLEAEEYFWAQMDELDEFDYWVGEYLPDEDEQ